MAAATARSSVGGVEVEQTAILAVVLGSGGGKDSAVVHTGGRGAVPVEE